jgi:hypothetical protein
VLVVAEDDPGPSESTEDLRETFVIGTLEVVLVARSASLSSGLGVVGRVDLDRDAAVIIDPLEDVEGVAVEDADVPEA